MKKKQLKRSWFCQCGYTFDEETGSSEYQEGNEGTSTRFCSGCNARTQMEWRVIENTDPDDELDEESGYCGYCQEFKPADIMNYDFENYSHPVCDYCLEKWSENTSDKNDEINEQTLVCPACGKMLMGNEPSIHLVCEVCKEIIENAYPDGWTCQQCDTVFTNEMPADTKDGTICKNCYKSDHDADMDAQDIKWGKHKV